MDPIKEAFSKIKQDILYLKNEILKLKNQIENIQTNPTHIPSSTTQQTDKQTHIQTNPTHNYTIEPIYSENFNISTRNNGVPTNKQTDRQTNRQIENNPNIDFKQIKNILESLDNAKKEIRLKFKRLTPQEMLVFTELYTLDEQNYPDITYKILAKRINLSESSIREYINKLIKKGVPIEKIRQNNKIIILKISQNLKNIATLSTIQKLREI